MPLYEFQCEKCHSEFETLVRKSEEIAAVVCPDCTSTEVRRTLSLPARPVPADLASASPCGEGPPCGASWCRRT